MKHIIFIIIWKLDISSWTLIFLTAPYNLVRLFLTCLEVFNIFMQFLSIFLFFITLIFLYFYILFVSALIFITIIQPDKRTYIRILIHICQIYVFISMIDTLLDIHLLVMPTFILCLMYIGVATDNIDKIRVWVNRLTILNVIYLIAFIYIVTRTTFEPPYWIKAEVFTRKSINPYPDFILNSTMIMQPLIWIGSRLQDMPDGWHSLSGGMAQIVTDTFGYKIVRGISIPERMLSNDMIPLSYQPGNIFNIHLANILYELKQAGFYYWDYELIANVNSRSDLTFSEPSSLSSIDWRTKYRFAVYLESFKAYYGIEPSDYTLHNNILELLVR